MKYYVVIAKCGHVGKGKYYEVKFLIKAESKSEAAQTCLKKPKVKKHLNNAITNAYEISYDEYNQCLLELKNNQYVRAHSKKEIVDYINVAERLQYSNRKNKNSFSSRSERVFYLLRKNKIQEEYFYA